MSEENKGGNPLGLTPEEIESIKKEYGLDLASEEVVKFVNSGISIKGIRRRITEDYFLKKLIEMVEKGSPQTKLGALRTLGQFMGWLKSDAQTKAPARRSILFEEN